ncbi:MAG: hypothetical protein ACQKBV_10230, partial [Puniceicoccales bacterium]
AVFAALSITACNKPTAAPVQASQSDAGFALLYSVAKQEQDVDKLLWVKDPGPEIEAWIRSIATFNKDVAGQLEAWQQAGKIGNLEFTGLPEAEAEARSRAASRTTGDLLFSEDVDLRVALIVAQVKAMGYCADLSYAIEQETKDQSVVDKAGEWEKRFQELNTVGMKMLARAPVATGGGAAAEPSESPSSDGERSAHSPSQPRK